VDPGLEHSECLRTRESSADHPGRFLRPDGEFPKLWETKLQPGKYRTEATAHRRPSSIAESRA
jgi:hypothetical protein